MIEKIATMPSVGETEVGSAEVHPTRDNQLKATNCRGDGGVNSAIPFHQGTKTIQSFPMPKKTSLPKAMLSLNRETDLSNSG